MRAEALSTWHPDSSMALIVETSESNFLPRRGEANRSIDYFLKGLTAWSTVSIHVRLIYIWTIRPCWLLFAVGVPLITRCFHCWGRGRTMKTALTFFSFFPSFHSMSLLENMNWVSKLPTWIIQREFSIMKSAWDTETKDAWGSYNVSHSVIKKSLTEIWNQFAS